MGQARDRDEASDVTQEREPVQLDFYGVKVRLTPSRVPEDLPDPGSWREVAKKVHQDLKAIAGGLIRLLRVTVESATDLIAGVGSLPQAFTRRIERAHAKGDDLEAIKQSSSIIPSLGSSALATDKIRRLLSEKAVAGNSVGIAIDEKSGAVILYALKSGAEESLPQLMSVIGSTLKTSGGLVSGRNSGPEVWGSASEEFTVFFRSLWKFEEYDVANALLREKLSIAIAGGCLTISCAKLENLESLIKLLERAVTREALKISLDEAFNQELTWSLVLEHNPYGVRTKFFL
jgi:hypothetical protein